MPLPLSRPSPLDGAFNFRDLGGLPAAGGYRIRHGRLHRSDTLQALSAADVGYLRQAVGLRTVIDLRLAPEVAEEGRGPLGRHGDIRYFNLPLGMASAEGLAPDEILTALYLSCLAPGSALPRALERVAEHADEPLVFHCAAGKDRTGLLAAVILRLLRVGEAEILADYQATAANMPRIIERFGGWPRYRDHIASMPAAVYAADAPSFLRFLAALDETYGGAEGWARANGVADETVARLRAALLEPA
ncbi:tyrosine-protein phosphatase [Zavarzinia compransoris]|uniref:Protein-tyrosine-phosphatase n=1 Tax=Zavarzinia compransoris TaxID=1264899 RepID=A0A317E525_9PROT|nr:tyrosine-protein phosphatase [Zavarzinia compransoris]PWR21672.1 protein-tyrosine-phosphatase [Zavarzinia compransoris]TDP45545.1 protein tyrosine/serine phosphatase [Zavarzinia compransoris]